MSEEIEVEIIKLMKSLGFNENETVAMLLTFDAFECQHERTDFLEKLKNNEITTQDHLGDYVRMIVRKYKK